MLSALKRLFSKSKATPASPAPSQSSAAAPAPSASAPAPVNVPAPMADGIPVSLRAVVAMLPDNLKKRLDRQLTGKELIYISRGDALRQLPTGSVKMQFSEVVRQAPNTFLSPDQEMLVTMVSIPLQEILPHIKTLPRRTGQRQLEVPQDLAPVFGTGSEPSREVKSTAPARTGSRPSPPPPETSDGPLSIQPPTPKPIPPPAPRPIPQQPAPVAPAPAAAPSAPPSGKPPEAYTPPPPKPLDEQKPITFSVAQPETPKPAPVPAPAPVAATPVTPPPAAFTSPPPAPISAEAPESALGFGDVFGQPQKKDWTPQEVVEKTATLRGVAGALITTIDGLPVAFHLPANLSGNAVAAFVPQMYTRITQYTRDLKLGDAKHLTILIENVPLQIFKTGAVYFTALGKANENLPKPQLTAIAAALGRQS